MSEHSALQRGVLWALAWIERYRYIKFGIVGASGVVVNLTVLYLGHEYLFNAIEASYKKPYLSLALAIASSGRGARSQRSCQAWAWASSRASSWLDSRPG